MAGSIPVLLQSESGLRSLPGSSLLPPGGMDDGARAVVPDAHALARVGRVSRWRWRGGCLVLGLLVACQEAPTLPEVSPELRLEGVVWRRLSATGPALTFEAASLDVSLKPGRAHQLGGEGLWQRWQDLTVQQPRLTVAASEIVPTSAPTAAPAPAEGSSTGAASGLKASSGPASAERADATGTTAASATSPSLLPLPSQAELEALNRASLELQAQKGLGRRQDNHVQFDGGVLVTRGSLSLKCDSLELQLGTDGRPQRLLATGQVRLQWGARSGSAGRVRWDEPSGELVLEQNPVLSEGAQRLQGGIIRWRLREGVVSCEQCRLSLPGEATP